MTYLSYDDTNMWSKASGKGGAHKKELTALSARLKEANKALKKLRTSEEQGFFDLPYDAKGANQLLKVAGGVKRKYKTLLVIGIGGSDLGARTIWEALGNPKNGVWLSFLSNPDPEVLDQTLSQLEWKSTAICVISKSGSTLETMSIFMAARERLIRAVGKGKHAKHVYAITDPGQGILFELAKENEYSVIPHPVNVGGRFSVLSSVGLFPAACGGVDIKKLLKGAKSIEDAHRKSGSRHMAARFAGLHYLGYKKRGQKLHICMPYAGWLNRFGFWYRQIWAESLGKKRGNAHVGPTPIAASGTVDQHSQIQLYNDGPNDKIVTFIEVEKFRQQVTVPKVWQDVKGIDYIGGLSFEQIMHAERKGTADALAKKERPNGTLSIPSISEESLGALFMFYELATAYMGQLFGIDAYNQPGVEEGKKIAKKLLS